MLDRKGDVFCCFCLFIGHDFPTESLANKVKFSLFIAEKFLSQIPTAVSNDSLERLKFEILAEGFLLFMIGTRDGLMQEINGKLSSPLSPTKVKFNKSFKDKLKNESNAKFQTILSLLEDCMQEPDKVIDVNSPEYFQWDRTKSWLWEVNEMRNLITHRSILNQHANIQIGSITGNQIYLTICNIAKKPIVKVGNRVSTVLIRNPKLEQILEENPNAYFKSCLDKMKNLVQTIVKLL